jgi:hypothetical protein
LLRVAAERSAGRNDGVRRNADRIGRRHQVRFARCDEIDERRKHPGIGSAIPQIIRRQSGDGEEARAQIGIGDDKAQQSQRRNKRIRRIVNTFVAQHVYDTLVARLFN